MSVTIRNRQPQRDPVARAHHRASLAKTVGYGFLILAFLGGLTWLLFASSSFAVTTVLVEGVSSSSATEIRSVIEDVLGKRTLGFLRPARNILLIDEVGVAQLVRATFKNINEVRVIKGYPHTLTIEVQERTPLGTWCHEDLCQYFDATGARWGSAVPSRGPLLLFVRDERKMGKEDTRVFTNLMTITKALPTLGMRPIVVVLPDTAPGDLRVQVNAGVDVLFDALANTDDQLDTLAVLISDKAKDPTWKPQYIDLRTPGRVYYK